MSSSARDRERDREAKERYDRERFAPYETLKYPYCDEDVKYEKLAKIGQGTFG